MKGNSEVPFCARLSSPCASFNDQWWEFDERKTNTRKISWRTRRGRRTDGGWKHWNTLGGGDCYHVHVAQSRKEFICIFIFSVSRRRESSLFLKKFYERAKWMGRKHLSTDLTIMLMTLKMCRICWKKVKGVSTQGEEKMDFLWFQDNFLFSFIRLRNCCSMTRKENIIKELTI